MPPLASEPIQAVERAVPIGAWTKFRQKQLQECQIDCSQPARVPLTPGVWATLIRGNETSTQSFWRSQTRRTGVWRIGGTILMMGDCEDMQLLKRKLLVGAGLPHRALRMTVVIDEQGQGYAVLMARIDRGDFILDNKRKAALP